MLYDVELNFGEAERECQNQLEFKLQPKHQGRSCARIYQKINIKLSKNGFSALGI